MGLRAFFHAAALTTEQVISDKRCLLHAILPDVASTAGAITLRNAPAAEKVGTPGSVTGTPSDTGGSLTNAHGAYFARIVAVDQHGELSAGSTEQSDTIASGTAGSIAYAWAAGTGAAPTSYRVYFGSTTGVFDRYFETTALALTVTADSGGVAITPADTGAATSGTAKTVSTSAAALLAAGKQFGGVACDRGLVLQLANGADTVAVVYEPF